MLILGLVGTVVPDGPLPKGDDQAMVEPAVAADVAEVGKSPGLEDKQATSTTVITSQSEDEAKLQSIGQRRINLIWEVTQALMSLGIMAVFAYMHVSHSADTTVVDNAFFILMTYYFVRTNHVAVGGANTGR